MAVWDYAAQSAKRIFGNTTGDRLADKIYEYAVRNGAVTRTEIHEALHRNVSSADIEYALYVLVGNGLVKISPEERNGVLVHYFRDSYSKYMRIKVNGNRQDSVGSIGATGTRAQGEEPELGSRSL
jgi:hypothetical protein